MPSFTLGVAERQPARDGRGLRDVRRPRPALRRAPGHLDRRRRRATCSRTTRPSASRSSPAVDRRRGQRRAARRPGARRLRRTTTASSSTSRRPARPVPPRTASRSGSWATPRSSPTAAMIAGANERRPAGSTLGRPDRRRHLHLRGVRLRRSPGPMWGDAMQVIEQWLPVRRLHPAERHRRPGRADHDPADRGHEPRPGQAGASRRPASPSIDGGTVDSSYSQGTVAYTAPGAGTRPPAAATVTIYVSDGTPYVAPARSRHRARQAQRRRQARRRWRRRRWRRHRWWRRPRRWRREAGRWPRRGQARSLSPARPAYRSAELATYLRGHRAAVGAALDLRLDHAHHPAHRLRALAGGAGLLDRGRARCRATSSAESCSGR